MVKPLLPVRHPERDFFICDFGDVSPKSDIASMEHPLFSLSTKPDTEIKNYYSNDIHVKITPSVVGRATINDKDVLIFCISQLKAGMNKGEEPSRKVKFKARDLLVTTNRQLTGRAYKLLIQSLERLSGTRIQTNIKTNTEEITKGFGIIESYEVVEDAKTKRMTGLEVTLSEWVFNSVIGNDVLNISRDYFRIRKPIERRIYEIARKHCGKDKGSWRIGIDKLYNKVGSAGSLKKFREAIKHITTHNHLPDYFIEFEKGTKNIIVIPKEQPQTKLAQGVDHIRIKTTTIDNIKKIISPKFDVYQLEAEWKSWVMQAGKAFPTNPDSAFYGFCKNKMKKSG